MKRVRNHLYNQLFHNPNTVMYNYEGRNFFHHYCRLPSTKLQQSSKIEAYAFQGSSKRKRALVTELNSTSKLVLHLNIVVNKYR